MKLGPEGKKRLEAMKKTLAAGLALAWLVEGGVESASAQELDWTSRVQKLAGMVHMGKAVSNELERIAVDASCPAAVRKAAQAALARSRPGTNDMVSIVAFLEGWSITNPPAVDLELIEQMDGILDLGASAMSILETDIADTNAPAWYRAFLNQMRENRNAPSLGKQRDEFPTDGGMERECMDSTTKTVGPAVENSGIGAVP